MPFVVASSFICGKTALGYSAINRLMCDERNRKLKEILMQHLLLHISLHVSSDNTQKASILQSS